MNEGLIPNRYAKALFKFAAESCSEEEVYSQTTYLVNSFESVDGMVSAIENPFLPLEKKVRFLETASGAPKDGTLSKFFRLVFSHGRENMMLQMALSYGKLFREDRGISQVVITTAAKLSQDAVKKIKASVQSCVGSKTLEFKETVNPELIGGFTVKIDSQLLDASVSSELRNLRLKLLSNK